MSRVDAGLFRCAGCSKAAQHRPATWSMQAKQAGVQWLCGACTREHLRSIEARLDEAWW